ncbi:MAG: autotransporter outer membrane beta-barrel domain-containing protein [Bdellovibrionales bacterium]
MTRSSTLSIFALATGLMLSVHPLSATELTARDLRMETQTHWDYQPMQGPYHPARERDLFTPGKGEGRPAPQTPPPPLVSGDYHNPPRTEDRVPPKPPRTQPVTTTSLEGGIQGSIYHYHEKDLGVKLDGEQFGFHLIGSLALGSQWFTKMDGRASGGVVEYEGSGKSETNPNYEAEVRWTLGRDFVKDRFVISPYVGVGYRYLHSDVRGVTSVNAHGYQRDNHMVFVPIGVQPKMQFASGDRVSLTLEYDPMISGWQHSYLSDVYAGYPDLMNRQTAGYGLRGDLMYEKAKWSFGPYVNYWNINQSDEKCKTGNDGVYAYTICGVEPHNHTLEYGIQLRYRFYEE